MSVVYKGKKYYVKKKYGLFELDLSGKKIRDISEIEGLENLKDDLVSPDVEQLDSLLSKIPGINFDKDILSHLSLKLFNNDITEIKGLENLTNLVFLEIGSSPIFYSFLKIFRLLDFE